MESKQILNYLDGLFLAVGACALGLLTVIIHLLWTNGTYGIYLYEDNQLILMSEATFLPILTAVCIALTIRRFRNL